MARLTGRSLFAVDIQRWSSMAHCTALTALLDEFPVARVFEDAAFRAENHLPPWKAAAFRK
jgi:hypothetical protein